MAYFLLNLRIFMSIWLILNCRFHFLPRMPHADVQIVQQFCLFFQRNSQKAVVGYFTDHIQTDIPGFGPFREREKVPFFDQNRL